MELPPLLTAKENPAVKQYRKLARLKKERMAQRKFVLEGVRLVTDACANGARLSHLMVTQDAWEQHAADWAQLDSRQTKISLLSDALAAQMGETEHPQGVFAICEMPEVIPLEKLLQTGNSYLLLHQVQDPGNLGMMLRTADALGIAAVICTEGCACHDGVAVSSSGAASACNRACFAGMSDAGCGNLCGSGASAGRMGRTSDIFRAHCRFNWK